MAIQSVTQIAYDSSFEGSNIILDLSDVDANGFFVPYTRINAANPAVSSSRWLTNLYAVKNALGKELRVKVDANDPLNHYYSFVSASIQDSRTLFASSPDGPWQVMPNRTQSGSVVTNILPSSPFSTVYLSWTYSETLSSYFRYIRSLLSLPSVVPTASAPNFVVTMQDGSEGDFFDLVADAEVFGFRVKSTGSDPLLLMMTAGQHPGETGTLGGMRGFLDKITANDAFGINFREHFDVIVYPHLNPIAERENMWRATIAEIDQNRSWGNTNTNDAVVDSIKAAIDTDVASLGKVGPDVFLDWHASTNGLSGFAYVMDQNAGIYPQLESKMQSKAPNYFGLRESSSSAGARGYMVNQKDVSFALTAEAYWQDTQDVHYDTGAAYAESISELRQEGLLS